MIEVITMTIQLYTTRIESIDESREDLIDRLAISGRVQWGQDKLCGSRRVVVEVTE